MKRIAEPGGILATPTERLATLRTLFRFWAGTRGYTVTCTQCAASIWVNASKPDEIWLACLDLLDHADGHPSF